MDDDKWQGPFLPGESKQIAGFTVVYIPDWMLTRADCPPHVVGVPMPADLADSFLAALRKAGIGFANDEEPRPPPPLPGDGSAET